jgi:hypothetical protein
MEKKLVKWIHKILLNDSVVYLWHTDESVDGHFRIGSPTQSYIECSWETIGKHRKRILVIRKDEYTHMQFQVEPDTELNKLLHLVMLQANHLMHDPHYQQCAQRNSEKRMMIERVNATIDYLIFNDQLKGLRI